MNGPMNPSKQKKAIHLLLLSLCLLLGIVLVYGYSHVFTAANFPYTQPDTYWTDNDGILSVRVSGEPIQSSAAFRRYQYQAYVRWNGETYRAAFGINPHAPLSLVLMNSDGMAIHEFAWAYHMPNQHELQLTFTGENHSDEAQLLCGKTKLILRRVG